MLKDAPSAATTLAGRITATAFRDDRSAELVTILDLRFDECLIRSKARFAAGERLRLHLHGQGWIEAEVHSLRGDEARLIFLTKSRC